MITQGMPKSRFKLNIVFISGPYRGDIKKNIEHARKVAKRLWARGEVVLCPHLNTAHFDGICPDEHFLAGDIEMLSRCDEIYMLKGWTQSEGAVNEYAYALKLGLDIRYEINDDLSPETRQGIDEAIEQLQETGA